MGKAHAGFTLIELMVTISVIAMIAMLAAPSFSKMLNEKRLATELKDLTQVLTLARSQAVLLRTNIVVNLNTTSNNTQTNFSWAPRTNGIVLLNVPEGYNAPPNIIFNAQGMFVPRSFVKMEKNPNKEWVATQVKVDEKMVSQLEHYPSTISLCSEKLHVSKTISYSVIGTFDSIVEGSC